MDRHKKCFNLARKNANLSDFDRIHIGCVATYKGKVISAGHNAQKTHPEQKVYNEYRDFYETSAVRHTIHAEMMCLNKIPNDIPYNKVKLYIYRIRKDIPHGLARPCPACMQRIKDLGIRNIYYTTNDGFAYEKISI